MTVVRDEEELIAVYLQPGTVFKMSTRMTRPTEMQYILRSDERYHEAEWRDMDALILYRPGDAYSVWRFQRADDQRLKMWYVNLEEPWTRTSIGFDSRDHGLDVVVAPDLSSWSWKDEDEMAQEIGGPPHCRPRGRVPHGGRARRDADHTTRTAVRQRLDRLAPGSRVGRPGVAAGVGRLQGRTIRLSS
jgi:hypothetical protein